MVLSDGAAIQYFVFHCAVSGLIYSTALKTIVRVLMDFSLEIITSVSECFTNVNYFIFTTLCGVRGDIILI